MKPRNGSDWWIDTLMSTDDCIEQFKTRKKSANWKIQTLCQDKTPPKAKVIKCMSNRPHHKDQKKAF